MAQGENFFLHSNEFQSNIKTFWNDLEVEKDFCDVTLACADKQITTHKVVISSCSPVFRNILKLNQNPHPLIYLRNVKYNDMQNLLTFMYQGEVNVPEEDLPSFLEVAEDLHIRGLSEENTESFNSNQKKIPVNDCPNPAPSPKRRNSGAKENTPDTYYVEPLTEICQTVEDTSNASDITVDDTSNGSDITVEDTSNASDITVEDTSNASDITVEDTSNDIERRGFQSQTTRITEVAKQDENGEIDQSLVSLIERKSFLCVKCDKQFSGQFVLHRHNASVHEGIFHSCNQCDHKAKRKDSLRTHVKSVHQGIKGPAVTCDKCDKQFSGRGALHNHNASVHEGVVYSCDQCDYKATQKYYLNKHVKSIH